MNKESVDIIDVEYKESGKRKPILSYMIICLAIFGISYYVTKDVPEELTIDYGTLLRYIEPDELEKIEELFNTQLRYYGNINMESIATYEFKNIHTGDVKYTLIQGKDKSILTKGQSYIVVENYQMEGYFK